MARRKTEIAGKTQETGDVVRRPGRPKKTDVGDNSAEPDLMPNTAESTPVRFNLLLPQGMLDDLELMSECTGHTYSFYIREAIGSALERDKKNWSKKKG